MNILKTLSCVLLSCILLQSCSTSQTDINQSDCNKIDKDTLNTISKLSIDKKWENAERTKENMRILGELREKEEKEKEEFAYQLWQKGKRREAICVLESMRFYYVSKYKLGELHYSSKEYDKAFELFTQSLDSQGYAGHNSDKSLYYLGELYEKGLGTKKDEKQAFRHYLMSAYAGDEKAMLKLSELYQKGILVDKDEIHGKFWLQTYYNTQYKRKEIKTPKTAIKIDKNLISKKNKPHWVIMPLALPESSRNYIWYFDVNSLQFRDEKNLAKYTMKFTLGEFYAPPEEQLVITDNVTYDCKNHKIHDLTTLHTNGKQQGEPKKETRNYEASPHKTPINFLFEDLCR